MTMTSYKKHPAIAELEHESRELGYTSKLLSDVNKLFVWVRNAREYIERCRSRRIAILGYEGFERVEGGNQSYLDMIVDLSFVLRENSEWQAIVDTSCDWALHWLTEMRHGEMFALEFVLETEEEWIKDREKKKTE
jgi:hypothetical protein